MRRSRRARSSPRSTRRSPTSSRPRASASVHSSGYALPRSRPRSPSPGWSPLPRGGAACWRRSRSVPLSSLFFAPRDVLDHVIGRNATEFSIDYAFAFATLAVLALGAFVLVAARIGSGRMRAYVIGAFAVVLLAGRAGASINFELDLAA